MISVYLASLITAIVVILGAGALMVVWRVSPERVMIFRIIYCDRVVQFAGVRSELKPVCSKCNMQFRDTGIRELAGYTLMQSELWECPKCHGTITVTPLREAYQ